MLFVHSRSLTHTAGGIAVVYAVAGQERCAQPTTVVCQGRVARGRAQPRRG
jgi:hypothetical protein